MAAALDFHAVPALSASLPPSSPDFFSPPASPDRRLGPCEVDDAAWAKMSTAASATKKRKKSDNKPQAQLNKCLNEKRRREQENIYIEELAELISASFADMSSLSVKPDKCAILQETVSQIRKIKEQERGGEREAVQQGEVSSSRPGVLTNEKFGPLLLEALEGFLFVVNSDGRVVFVTENVSQFIKYSKDEVMGMTIYNILHVGDHTRFSSSLLPLWAGAAGPTAATDPPPRSRTFNARFLVKPPDDASVEQKQQRVLKYENMQISSTQLPYSGSSEDDEGDGGPCLMCVARRIPANEKQLGAPIEQFTMKLDATGLILDLDASGVSSAHAPLLGKELRGRNLKELCHSADLGKLTSHLKETLVSQAGTSTSSIYRLKVGHEKLIHVQTKSKLFKGGDSDFIMATHSIIGDNEVAAIAELMVGNSSSGGGGVGGPLISSVNGGCRTTSDLSNTITLSTPSHQSVVITTPPELGFDFDFPPTTFDQELSEERPVWPNTPSQSPLYPGPPGPTSYPLSPLGVPDPNTDPHDQESDGPVEGEAHKLRTLLTRKATGESEVLKVLLRDPEDSNQDNNQQSSQPANNMLLKLLNDKSDDDDLEGRAGLKKQDELLQQLFKEEDNQEEIGSGMSPERVRKRPSSEEEDGRSKRSLMEKEHANHSKLCEKNKMLAQLLSQQPTQPTHIPQIPESVITATPQDKIERLKQQPQPSAATVAGVNQAAAAAGGGQGWAAANRVVRRPAPPQWDQSDQVLSDILDQVIDIAPDTGPEPPAVLMNMMDSGRMGPGVVGLSQELMTQERLAISAIQKSLEQCETVVSGVPYSQPSTPLSASVGSSQQQQFPPPPIYQQRQRFPSQMQTSAVTTQRQNTQYMQVLMQQRNKMLAVQQQKQRLLQQQQQQHLLIPSSAASAPVDPNIHNIGSLMNDSVAPNVALQRSGSVGEAQLSPGAYAGGGGGAVSAAQPNTLMGNSPQLSPAQAQPRQPYSPQPFSPVSYQGQGAQQGGGGGPSPGTQQARLSPSGLTSYQAQHSPRVSQGQQSFQQTPTTWSQQQASRLSLQQQQNPMLNAQLAAGNGTVGTTGRFQTLPPVRSLTSPGARQSPFPPELSPTSASSYQFRRAPQAPTSQLPGVNPALIGRHHYGGKEMSSGGYPPMYPPPQLPPPPPQDFYHDQSVFSHHQHIHRGGGNNGMTEYVRQELRAVLGARTTPRQPHESHLEDLGIPFDMPPSVSDSPKMWGDMAGGSPQAGASPLTPRNPVEEVARANEQKSSLLQKLLSE